MSAVTQRHLKNHLFMFDIVICVQQLSLGDTVYKGRTKKAVRIRTQGLKPTDGIPQVEIAAQALPHTLL